MGIFNINSGGGGSYIRFMPSANAWVYKGEEITLGQIVIDHDSVRTGWGKMSEGQAPEWQWDERLGVSGRQPSPDHKRGFSIIMYTKQTGSVEWSSTGTGPVIGFEKIFEEIWNAKDANQGKCAVIDYTGSTPMKIGKGNTRTPNFKIAKWVNKTAIPWQSDETAPAAPAPAAPAPAPKPAPKAAPDPALDDEIAF
jgi:hypothetical protein